MWAPTGRQGCWRTARSRAALVLALVASAGASRADGPAAAEGAHILVRLRAEGPHAVTDCAETRQRRGEPLAGATEDGSDSLDRLHAQLRVQRVRALFRRPDGRAFAAQRAALARRAEALRGRRPASSRARLPEPPDLSHVYRLELAAGVDPRAAAVRYRADPHVVWAQADFRAVLDGVADDPFLHSSGSWGQSFADLWGIHRVRAPAAWDHALGEDVVVAVVDTGVDLDHPDLRDNAWVHPGEDLDGNGRVDEAERNGVDDDGNGFVDDFHGFDLANSVDADGDGDFDDPEDVSDADPFDDLGHGTHVAGIVAAVANNGIGLAGVAPRARIMALKGFGADGSATFGVLVQGMVYAVENGADVINNSWSCAQRCPSNPIVEEVVEWANALGVVVVTSAGNGGDDVRFYSPENRRGTLVAGASDPDDDPTTFTNTGMDLDLLAPGGAFPFGAPLVPHRAILSLLSSGADEGVTGFGAFVVGEHYLRWSGTSMAAPHVAGIAALVLSRRPELTPDEVRGILRASARDLGTAGHDRLTGAGLADALAAVTRAPPAAGGAFEAPPPAAILRPQAGPVPIRGRLFGDVADAQLSFGLGGDPALFEPIPLGVPPGPVEGELAVWDVAGLADGPYLLRLEVAADDGERVVEFRWVALERNVPVPLSSEGPAALDPAVSGRTVVWQSDRPAGTGEADDGLDLFARDWAGGEEWRVAGGPGDQRDAHLSGGRLVWRDDREELHAIASCRLAAPGRPCRPSVIAVGARVFPGLDVSGPRIVWTEFTADGERLRACAWRGAACRPLPVPALSHGVRQSDPALTGTRLYWNEWSGFPPRLFTCGGFGVGACVPMPVRFTIASPLHFDASGDLLAWSGGVVSVCRVTPDGRCDEKRIAASSGFSIAVSGQRVVWSGPGPGGDDDVFYCEHDRLTGTCPVQRINGSPANQRNASIDGDRVVWEDDGEGFVSILGLELPSLHPVRDRRLRAGQTLRILVRGHDPAGGAPELSAAFADGTSLAARGARFEDLGVGVGHLTWRTDAAAVGSHVVTFAARGDGGLVARRSARFEVAP